MEKQTHVTRSGEFTTVARFDPPAFHVRLTADQFFELFEQLAELILLDATDAGLFDVPGIQ